MTEQKMVSEKEAVRRERAAFEAGAHWRFCRALHAVKRIPPLDESTPGIYHMEAAERYPLPKVERPRVVATDGGSAQWRVKNGEMQCLAQNGRTWLLGAAHHVTRERLAVWADLFASPNELVEDDS